MSAGSVMIPRLQEVDPIVLHEIDQTMLRVESLRFQISIVRSQLRSSVDTPGPPLSFCSVPLLASMCHWCIANRNHTNPRSSPTTYDQSFIALKATSDRKITDSTGAYARISGGNRPVVHIMRASG